MVVPKSVPTLLVTLAIVMSALSPVAAESEIVRLSLDECLRAALKNNLDLVSARKDPEIARLRVDESSAEFDGAISVTGTFDKNDSDGTITGTDFSGATIDADRLFDRDNVQGDLTWSQLLSYGATYDVSLSTTDEEWLNSRFESVTGFVTDTSRATRTDQFTVSYSMPLLRGFGNEAAQLDLLLARSGVDTSTENFRQQAITTLKSTEDAYWDLVAARAAHDVSLEALKLAQDLYEQNKKKVEVGSLAPIDVTQAEAGVAAREEDVIVAEVTVRNAEDNLRRFMAVPTDDRIWMTIIEPVDAASFEERSVSVPDAISVALERRPEIINARRANRENELSERVARNGARPSLTLDASINPTETDEDEATIRGIAGSDSNTLSDGRNWRVGMTYGYTVGNKRAKANYAIARINREKGELALRNVEQDIRVDVRAAARAVTSGSKRVAAARANTVLQRKNAEAEQKKYENGMSTSFEVLRILNDLSDAQLAEIRAVLDYTKAQADLERAKGTLLEARGLALGS